MSVAQVHANSIDTPLARQARRLPDKVAVTFGDRSWTFREYDDAVSRVAAYLGELGLKKGDRVAAYGQNSDAFGILYYACARAGMVHVPLNYALTGGELEYLVDDSGASAIFADPHLDSYLDALPNVPAIRLSLLEGDDSILARSSAGEVPDIEPVAEPNDLAQLLYTSGTTSRPKGSMMSHRAMSFHMASCIAALDIDEDDVNVECMPLYHSAGMHCFFTPFIGAGATTHLLQVPDVPKIMQKVEETKATTLFLAPTVWVRSPITPTSPAATCRA